MNGGFRGFPVTKPFGEIIETETHFDGFSPGDNKREMAGVVLDGHSRAAGEKKARSITQNTTRFTVPKTFSVSVTTSFRESQFPIGSAPKARPGHDQVLGRPGQKAGREDA